MPNTEVVNLKHDAYDVYIGRTKDGGYGFGNPFLASTHGHQKCIELFRNLLYGQIREDTGQRRKWILDHIEELRGKRLGCFCRPKPCHGDVYVRILTDGLVPYRPDLGEAKIKDAQRKWLPKDQYKSNQADCLLATNGSTGATGEYARIWREANRRVNKIIPMDICFISANGLRYGAQPPPLELIKFAAAKWCTFYTDDKNRRPEGGNTYNVGEQQVANLLRSLDYRECNVSNPLVSHWKRSFDGV